ncbi:MAG: site-2 protease family protein [Planctomycetota bacterium]
MDSYTFARLFGIPIKVTVPFLWIAGVLAAFSLLGRDGGVFGIAMLLLLLVSVLLHELGHALVARSFGVRVVDITLWHLGGMARMSEIPETPRVEAWIAIAGPAVNLALALVASPLLLLPGPADGTGALIVANFVVMNVLLGVLNLLPGFPMDGGRILRAFLATRTDHLTATESAVRVGKWTAGGMVVVGAISGASWLFVALLVGAFVWFAGTRELIAVRIRHTGSPFGAAFAERMFGFGGAAGRNGARGAGSATGRGAREAEVAEEAERSPRADAPDTEGGARRPTGPPSASGRGFSEEDVRRLEQWRGPLRRYEE